MQGASAGAKVPSESREMGELGGFCFAEQQVDLAKLRAWKDGVVKRPAGGVAGRLSCIGAG